MKILIIVSALLVIAYVGIAIWRKKELPESISATVYELPKAGQWLWSAWLAAVSALLFYPLVENVGGLGWLTVVCLFGTALTPLVKADTKKWHYAFAIAAGVLSQVCVAFICADWLFAWSIFIFLMGSVYVQPEGSIAKAVTHKGVFVATMVCFISLIGCLLFN